MPSRIVLCAFAALAIFSVARAGEQGGVPWTDDFKAAFSTAKKDAKPVLADIWATWCAPCKLMDQTTYRDADVLEALKNFVPLKIDADSQKTFIERYRIEAFPTVLFLDGDGREIARLLGFVDVAKLLAAARSVGPGYADYLKAAAAGKDPAAQDAIGRYLLAADNPVGAIDSFKRALKGIPASETSRREPIELAVAEAQLAAGDAKPASAAFARLADKGGAREVKARALAGLWRAESARKHTAEAEKALARLRAEYPDLAPALEKP